MALNGGGRLLPHALSPSLEEVLRMNSEAALTLQHSAYFFSAMQQPFPHFALSAVIYAPAAMIWSVHRGPELKPAA